MRLSLLLILLLLLSGGPVSAQINSSQTQADTLAAPPPTAAQPDTLAAIHRLFALERKKNKHSIVWAVGIGAIGGVLIGTSPSGWNGLDQAFIGVSLIIFISFPILIADAIIAFDYNNRNERRAVGAFQAHKLSKRLKRSLKPKYFH